ncbi:MAG: hypothetical protein JWR44_3056 [Hymenobacter sp.]|nr:hypothetical protein [Hymenobacter sp.]
MPNSKNMRGGSSEQHAENGRKGGEARAMSNQGGNSGGSTMRGFAAMDPEEQRRIAAQGGRASHMSGRGHEFTSEEAREAGRKGGEARAMNNQNGSNMRGGSKEQHSQAGRKGGEASGGNR